MKYSSDGSYNFETEKGRGRVKVTLEIQSKDPDFLSSEAINDPIIAKLITNYLTIVGAILTNILYFYEKSPTLSAFIAGSLGKETAGKNEHYQQIMRNLPK